MLILALDSAVGRCSASLIESGAVVAERGVDTDRGQAALMPVMVRDILTEAGLTARAVGLVAVTVGPGSFTGIRGGVALAQGFAAGAGIPVAGVTVGEALAQQLPHLGGRLLWVAIASRRGRAFLEIGDQVLSVALAELPNPRQPIALAGGAAPDVTSRLAARGANVMLTDARLPIGRHIALVGLQRHLGQLPPRPAEPLYVDAPEARPG